jgi:Leucine-rich repeat (LRR) protein
MKINCRKNKIKDLSSFPKLPKLVYLNIRENEIAKVDDLSGVIDTVRNINLLGNPVEAEFGDNTKK